MLNRRKASNPNCFVSPGLAPSVLDFAHLDPPLPLRCAARVGVASAVLSCPGGVFGGVETLEIQGLEAGMSQNFVFVWLGLVEESSWTRLSLGSKWNFNGFKCMRNPFCLLMVVSQSVNNMHCPINRNILALSIVQENNIARTSTSGSSNGKSRTEGKPRTFLKKTRAIEQWRHKVGIQKFPGLHEWWQVRSISDLVGQDLVKVEVEVNRRNLQYSNDPTFPERMSSRVNSPPSALKNTVVSPIYLCWFVLTHLTNYVWDIWLYPFERIWCIYIYMIGISWEYLTNTTIHGYDSNKNFSMNYSNLVATSLESWLAGVAFPISPKISSLWIILIHPDT